MAYQTIHNSVNSCVNSSVLTSFARRNIQQYSLVHENPTTCRVLKLVTAFVNVNGRDPILNPGLLSQRPDKSTRYEPKRTIALGHRLRNFSYLGSSSYLNYSSVYSLDTVSNIYSNSNENRESSYRSHSSDLFRSLVGR